MFYRSAEKVQKNAPRVDWVNSSKAYKKEEIDVPGAPRVKKITKVGPIDLHTDSVIIVKMSYLIIVQQSKVFMRNSNEKL
jgi:hypothetical protein